MSAMAASTSTKPDIDLLSPAFYGDIDAMHDAFTWLRHNDPLHRDESSGFVGVTKHADILEVEHRDEVFSSKGSYRSIQNPDEDNMIAQDDPQHLAQQIGRAHVCTPVNNAQLVCRLLLEKKKKKS